MTEYGLNLYWKSLFARIATLERYGVVFTLSEDAEELTIQIPRSLRGAGFREDIRNTKPEFLEAVRLREGLCVTCGMDAAKRPKRAGVHHNWIPETMKVETAKCSALGVCPIYCDTCWEARLMWRGLVEKKNAGRKQETESRTEEAAALPSSVRRGRASAPDPDRDSGGGGVGVLTFTAD